MLVLFLAFGCANEWHALDADGDGWTVAAGDCWDETAPHGGLEGSEIHPDAPDVPYDGVDADCAGDDDFDHDGDGYVTSIWSDPATEGIPSSLPGGDCWDDRDEIEQEFGALPGFPQLTAAEVHPGAAETWYDGIDADCDGGDDFDQDADGHPSAFHRDGASTLGDDCFDAEGDAFQNPASLAPADVHPDAFDTCYDATDADCDGASDWDCDHDGFLIDADCDDENVEAYPGAIEKWYDGIDQDCDGNDADRDHDGYLELGCAFDVRAPGIAEGDCWDDPTRTGIDERPRCAADVHPATETLRRIDRPRRPRFRSDGTGTTPRRTAKGSGLVSTPRLRPSRDQAETCGRSTTTTASTTTTIWAPECIDRYHDTTATIHGAIGPARRCRYWPWTPTTTTIATTQTRQS